MNEHSSDLVWVVVKVESGIPVFAQAFSDETDAERLENRLRAKMNPENDEVGIFPSRVK